MKKKLLSALLTVSMLLILLFSLGTPASAATGGTTGSCTWTVSGTTLIISGNGPMADYSDSNLPPWFDVASSITTIEVREGVTSIGDYAFAGCVSATAVLLPNYSLARMGDAAFLMCNHLYSFAVPATVTELGTGVFAGCYGLGTLAVAAGNPVYSSESNCIVENASGRLVVGCKFARAPKSIPVRSVATGAFMMINYAFLEFSDGLLTVEPYAFAYSSNFSISFPDSATEFGEGAFYATEGLTFVKAPKIKHIPPLCFAESQVRPMSLLDHCESIGYGAFMFCEKVTSVNLPETLKSIGDDAFYGCSINKTVNIPNSLQWVGISAFSANPDLLGFKVAEDHAYFKDAGNCLIEKESGKVITGCSSSTLPAGEGIRSIGDYAFAYTEIKSVQIPEGVTTIGEGAFAGCAQKNTMYVRFPESLTSVGAYAFADCDLLSEITFCKRIPTFHSTAFENTPSQYRQVNVWLEGVSNVSLPTIGNAVLHYADNFCDTTCNSCQAQRYDPSAGHRYDNDCDTDCNVCLELRTVGEHSYDNACDTTCNKCGEERTVPDHVYDNICDETCNECNARRSGHDFENACDTDCGVCGLTRSTEHHTKVPTKPLVLTNCESFPFELTEDGWYRSSNHGHNTESKFTVIATHPCRLRVTFKASTEPVNDYLLICYNTSRMRTVHGDQTKETTDIIPMNTGSQVTLTYQKNGSISQGEDCCWFKISCDCGPILNLRSSSLNPTCTEAVVCSDCGETVKEATGHAYSTDCDTDCNTCGETRVAAEHIYSDPCDASCNTCGEGRTPPHSYTDACDGVCDLCEKGRTPPHVYDGASDLVCNSCGHERPPYVPGDLDGKEGVDMDDAIYLLFAINFPDSYETNQPLDFDGSGKVDMDDAIYLLFHVNFSEQYPLFPTQNS